MVQKIRQHPVLAIVFTVLALFTLLNIIDIMKAVGTPADLGLIVLVPRTTIAGLLALYVLSRIFQNNKPQTAELKSGQTTLPRTISIIAATISGCVAVYFALPLINMAAYSAGQPGNNTVPPMFYVFFGIPLVVAVIIFIMSVRSLKKK